MDHTLELLLREYEKAETDQQKLIIADEMYRRLKKQLPDYQNPYRNVPEE